MDAQIAGELGIPRTRAGPDGRTPTMPHHGHYDYAIASPPPPCRATGLGAVHEPTGLLFATHSWATPGMPHQPALCPD